MHLPPKQLRRFAGLFETIGWLAAVGQWLIEETLNLRHGQELLTHMAGELSDQVSQTQTNVGALATAFADASARVDTQLQQLIDAQASGNQTEFNNAVAALQGVNSQLSDLAAQAQAMSTRLASDDPAASPPAP